jgi:outer membrane protein assembly factor BamA
MIHFSVVGQWRISQIVLVNENRVKTQKDVIVRELTFREGDTVSIDQLDSLKKVNDNRLFNMQLFNKAAVLFDTASYNVVCSIYVEERFPLWPDPNFTLGDRNFNVWARDHEFDLKRVNLGLKLSHLNIGGKRMQLGVLYQLGYTSKMGIEFIQPYIDKAKKHGWGWNVYQMSNREIAYQSVANKLVFYRDYNAVQYKEWNTELFYTHRPGFAFHQRVGLKYTQHQISDTVLQLNADFWSHSSTRWRVLQLNYRAAYNGVDNWNYPLTGYRFVLNVKCHHGIEDNFNQLNFLFQADYYKKLGQKWYLALDAKTHIASQHKYAYLYSRNLGYDNDYVRGYEYYVLDGQFMAYARCDLKYELWRKSIALPFRYFETVPIRLYPKIFADIGYSYDRYQPQFLNNTLLYALGLGLDVVTLYDIKVRFEFTFNHLKESDLYIHRKGN